MMELVKIDFSSGNLPKGWSEQLNNYTVETRGLRSNAGAILQYILPGGGFKYLRVEIEIEAISGAHVTCSDGIIAIIADLTKNNYKITSCGRSRLAENHCHINEIRSPIQVVFEFNHGRILAYINEVEVIVANDPNPTPAAGLFEIGIWDDCLVRSIKILGADPVGQITDTDLSRRKAEFHLEVAVDFFDDLALGAAPWTHQTFDRLFSEFKSWGVKRCHWIYYGEVRDGWFQNARGIELNFKRTIDNVGEIFPAAVRAAHAHGIEIYGLLKPFDMGLPLSYGESTPQARRQAKLPRIGGPIGWIADFAAKHREFIMARKPSASGPSKNEIFTRIDLVKQDEKMVSFCVNDVRLFVSEDNTTYVPYEGPITREEVIEDYAIWEHTPSGGRPTELRRKSRVMRFKDLEIRAKYVVLSVPSLGQSFSNSLINLIHVFGPEGEERFVTYGLSVRSVDFERGKNVTLISKEKSFLKNGVEFDKAEGLPTSLSPGFDAIAEDYSFDSGEKILALARGKERGTIAALSPSFPEVREWWLSWLRSCLDAGADGVELRVRNHHSPLAWGEYGFEKPVRDEFLERYGVDIWEADDFDKTAWRKLRGEGYTEFCRAAKRLAVSYGKPLGIHVSDTNSMEPNQGAAMNIHWNWREWIDEGIADSITMKDCWPRSRLAEEIFSHAGPKGIPVVFSPYANDIWQTPAGEKTCKQWIELAHNQGCSGYQFYECAAVVLSEKTGAITMLKPALRDLLAQKFIRAERTCDS